MTGHEKRIRWVLCLLSAGLVVVPFVVVQNPPSTDLPQHIAQIRLFTEALADPAGPYRIQLFQPYNLVYSLTGLCYWILGPADAGRASLAILGILSTGVLHLLAARLRLAPECAVLASAFFFSVALSWGLVNFLIGWPLFVLWLLVTDRREVSGKTWANALATVGLTFVLFFAHALWYAAAIGWLGVQLVVFRTSIRTRLIQVTCVIPSAVVASIWYWGFSKSWFAQQTPMWRHGLSDKLSPAWLVNSMLGGLTGPVDWIVLGAVAAWIIVGLYQCRGSWRTSICWTAMLASSMFLVVGLFGPWRFQSTIFFDQRWMAFVPALMLIAVPPPTFRPLLLRSYAITVLAGLCLSTALAWSLVETYELGGMVESVRLVPAASRVIGLDFVRDSRFVPGRPFMQNVAYCQVERGGTIGFSFASFPQSLVVFKDNESHPPYWEKQLEWWPEAADAADLSNFDYVLVNGSDEHHDDVTKRLNLIPVTTSIKPWRLYRTR